ncbi:imelysin family protein [Termitidicoccus mucosus]
MSAAGRGIFLLAGILSTLLGGISHALPTESDVLSALVSEGVQPSWTQVADTAGRLEASVRVVCENPTAETLGQARAAWRDAYLAWRRAAPFLFGPADKLERRIGRWAVNGVVLDAAVDAPDLAYLLKQTDQRGYAAAEYLLFTPADAAAVTAAGRGAHLRDVTEEITRLTARAKLDWEERFAHEFTSAGDGNPFLLPADALSRVVSELLNIIERMLRDRIGMPSGFFERTAVKPESLEAWRSGNAKEGFQATLDGIRQAVTGGGDASLANLVATKDGLVEARNPALANDITNQINRIEKTIAGLGGDDLRLEAELPKKLSQMKRLYKQLQKLQDQLVEASLVLELDVHGGNAQALPGGSE